MKIAFFLSDITKIGGIERVTSLLANYLSNNPDLKIDIVSLFKGRDKPNYFISDKINIYYLSESPHGAKPHSLGRIKSLLKKIGNVKSFFSKADYDIVLAQSYPSAFALFFTKFPKNRVIAVEHVYAQYYNRILQKIRAFIYRRFGRVVVLTNNDKNFFDSLLPHDKTIVIPNPVYLTETKTSPLENKLIISVGRLEYQKGYDTLIDCMKEIHIRFPEWRLNIYGDGTLKNKLQDLIDNNNLTECITLCGQTDDINSKLREASFYVMSSHFEGFPMVLVEAMSQGLPCISFDCPNGPSDIIVNGENGILVPDQNKDELIKAIITLINDKNYRKQLGFNATKSINIFSIENISQQWEKLFEEVR